MIGWPGRIALSIGAALAVVLSGLLIRRFRSAPVIVGSLAVAAAIIWPALQFGADAGGLKIGGVAFSLATSALVIAALIVAAMQLWQLASTPRVPGWVRFVPVALTLYAVGLIVFALTRGAESPNALSGEGPVPWWMSGAYLGGAVIVPVAVLVSIILLAVAIARRRASMVMAGAVLVMMLSAFAISGLELTRNHRPNLAQFLVPSAFAGASANLPRARDRSVDLGGQPIGELGAGDETLLPFQGKDLDETFALVAEGIRYEPYRGILRGARGTAIARSANSSDRAMLLADVLRRTGYKVRFARGSLADGNVDAIIEGIYPPGVIDPRLSPDFLPYNPTSDTTLRSEVREHMWIEVYQGSDWLPLDPSFPRAKPGESYALVTEHFTEPAAADFHTIESILREEAANGQVRELARVRVNVADIGFKPITLIVRAVPQVAGGDAAGGTMRPPAGALGGMGGALGGGAEPAKQTAPVKKTDMKVIGLSYVRTLTIGSSPEKVARSTVLDTQPQTALRREWIEFNLAAPGKASRRIERGLFQSEAGSKPADHRTYTISVVPGRVPRSFADQQTRLARTLIDPEAMQKRAASLAGIGRNDPRAKATASELDAMAASAGTVGGQLLALRFAVESDSISRLIADGSGVALAWAVPRILITGVEVSSAEGNRVDAKVSLDLRLDEVKAYPYRGAPTRLARVFQTARGIQESVIEGGLIAVATGRDESANTALLMRAAEKEKVQLLVINASTRSRLPELVAGLPAACVQLMNAALSQGREIVVPSRAVQLAGAPRFGWWEVDSASGATIGVMEGGEHQAMAETALSTEKIALDDDMGLIVGAVVGAITTVGTLSALLLEYGDVTPELVARLEKYVEDVMCTSCFDKFEGKIELSAGGDCLKEILKLEAGGNVGISFCDNYYKGFKCSASLIVSNLKGKNFEQFAKAEISAGGAAGCKPIDIVKYSGPPKS